MGWQLHWCLAEVGNPRRQEHNVLSKQVMQSVSLKPLLQGNCRFCVRLHRCACTSRPRHCQPTHQIETPLAPIGPDLRPPHNEKNRILINCVLILGSYKLRNKGKAYLQLFRQARFGWCGLDILHLVDAIMLIYSHCCCYAMASSILMTLTLTKETAGNLMLIGFFSAWIKPDRQAPNLAIVNSSTLKGYLEIGQNVRTEWIQLFPTGHDNYTQWLDDQANPMWACHLSSAY